MLNKSGSVQHRDHGAALSTRPGYSTPCHFIWEIRTVSVRRNENKFEVKLRNALHNDSNLTGFCVSMNPKRKEARKTEYLWLLCKLRGARSEVWPHGRCCRGGRLTVSGGYEVEP